MPGVTGQYTSYTSSQYILLARRYPRACRKLVPYTDTLAAFKIPSTAMGEL